MPKPYPQEFRDDVVRVARDRGEGVTIEQVAKDFGVHPMTLHKWMRRADIDEGRSPGVSATESAELREARKRILDTGDLATLGLGAPLPLGGGSSHATPAATVTPSAPASPAPSTTGLSASATANAQPVTSGTSAQGLHTSTDVTGRSGEPRGAFSVGPETKTSGATGTGTSGTAPASATGTRPMGAGGMPMMPMGGMGGPGGGGGKDREQAQTVSAAGNPESDALHGRHTAAEAVPGGTIAQKDHPRRRGEDAA